MSAYKPFSPADIIVSPFIVNKSFVFKGETEFSSSNVGIDRFIGQNLNTPQWASGSNPTGNISIYNKELVYNSIKHLYYSNFLNNPSGSTVATASFNPDSTITGERYTPNYYNYLSTTVDVIRSFPTGSNERIGVISIPSNLFGEYISPSSFVFESALGTLSDNGNGKLLFSSSLYSSSNVIVGDIIYEHGLIVLDENPLNLLDGYGYISYGSPSSIYGGIFSSFISSSNVTCSFESTMTIYETQYKCTITEKEFNLSLNPTLLSGSSCNVTTTKLKDFTTGSLFSPYITTVGLYNNSYELIAVAKLSQPLPTSPTTDTTILINLDL